MSFFKDFKAELKKVIWPTPKQLVNSTIAVVVIVIITAAIVLVLDVLFDLFNKYGINKLKSNIRGYETVQIQDEHEEEQTEENSENETSEITVDANGEVTTEQQNEVENETVNE